MTRDIASAINHQYGDVFVLPEAKIDESVMTIPGIDGQKMSKSYGNTIDIFQADKALRKNIMKIVSDSTPLEEPKDPDSDNTFALYSLLASESETEEMRQNYLYGNYGYGHAKQALYELIIEKYAKERALYNDYMNNLDELEKELAIGEEKASAIAREVLLRVKKALGFA
ncbi:MAG: tryptophan--tRNA ligase, partial [Cytophagia bacterium]|nr:tryptophan--tRNA ligase [Cytophagia bacterium]